MDKRQFAVLICAILVLAAVIVYAVNVWDANTRRAQVLESIK